MEFLRQFVDKFNSLVWETGIPVGEENISIIVIALIGTGFFLTLRLGFIQLRHFGHGVGIASGKYDDPNEPGDVSHFQALTTALSATVGIGNIAGVALAIHWGGPGALFWMWVTAAVGMATKYSEVTLAQHFRDVHDTEGHAWEGTVSGGPMYYIEKGLGPKWKPLAVLFAILLGITAFFTGNAIQANTVADAMQTNFGMATWVTGLITSAIVAVVILGGISRIGKVTGILAPLMAGIYVFGAMVIIILNIDQLLPSFATIFREAFNPTAGVAGTGVGAFLVTLMWGVRRGLFSNEAGQGSAPIAHAAAKTDEPVSEGAVALLEPFIDTIVIVTMTALVIIMTGVWNERTPEEITLDGGDIGWITFADGHRADVDPPAAIQVANGRQVAAPGEPMLAWHEVSVDDLFTDEDHQNRFTGTIFPQDGNARGTDGTTYTSLFGDAVESGAPLTMLGFRQGLSGVVSWGHYIVILSVLLFGISTAISWSYYGDRCASYLFGTKAVLPYKFAFVTMHFVGAVLPLTVIWEMGDIFLGIVILPNLIALILLSPKLVELTKSYFEREPWIENAEAHKRAKEEGR